MLLHRRLCKDQSGYLLADLLLSTVLIGVLAAVALPNLTAMDRTAKIARFSSALANLQSASDRFHAATGAYPTYAGAVPGTQPVATTLAAEINPAAQDGQYMSFWPAYLRVMPDRLPAHFALIFSPGSALFFGVAATGKTFATLVPPQGGTWTDGTTPVYIEESTATAGPAGLPRNIPLSAIW